MVVKTEPEKEFPRVKAAVGAVIIQRNIKLD